VVAEKPPNAPLTIAIVGGGIAGLTAGLCLAARGHHVSLFERSSEFRATGAGIQLGANAMAVMAALGLGPEIEAIARTPERAELIDGHTGKALATVPFGQTSHARYGYPHCVVHRADLMAVLVRAATAARVALRTDAEVTEAAGQLIFSSGEGVLADLVIAADGLNSTLRQRVIGPKPPSFTGHIAWRATVPMPDGLASVTQNWLLSGRHVVTYPLRHGRETLLNIVAVKEDPKAVAEGWDIGADPEALRAAFSDAAQPLQASLEQVTDCKVWGLYSHKIPTWHKGHVVLIGDAAHPTLPYLAQGAGMGIEDAWCLSDCLSKAPIADALKQFASLRRPRTDKITDQSTVSGRIYHMGGLRRAGRNIVLRRKSPEALLARLDWLYGHDVTRPT